MSEYEDPELKLKYTKYREPDILDQSINCLRNGNGSICWVEEYKVQEIQDLTIWISKLTVEELGVKEFAGKKNTKYKQIQKS